jgi:hypothetical protein
VTLAEHTPLATVHGVSNGFDEAGLALARAIDKGLDALARIHSLPPRPPSHGIVWASKSAGISILDDERRPLQRVISRLFGDTRQTALQYVRDALVYTGPNGYLLRGHVRQQLDALRAATGRPAVVYAHSLGSVILMDLVLDALEAGEFDAPPEEWLIRGVVSTGSPLAVDIPGFAQRGFRDRAARVSNLAARGLSVPDPFTWVNCYDADDPIATGSLTGTAPRGAGRLRAAGYERIVIADVEVDAGVHLGGHTAYHSDAVVLQTVAGVLG